eukprot:2024934-Rhodomonas_salina.2
MPYCPSVWLLRYAVCGTELAYGATSIVSANQHIVSSVEVIHGRAKHLTGLVRVSSTLPPIVLIMSTTLLPCLLYLGPILETYTLATSVRPYPRHFNPAYDTSTLPETLNPAYDT